MLKPQYPIAFTETGDTTTQALQKAYEFEYNRIYSRLNSLVANLEALPTEGARPSAPSVGQVHFEEENGEGKFIAYNGTEWVDYFVSPLPFATEASPGIVTLSKDESFGSDVTVDSVVTEKQLSKLLQGDTGFPIGTIIPWYKPDEDLPFGWVLYAEGLSRIPLASDSSDVKELGGNDYVDIPPFMLQRHQHVIDAIAEEPLIHRHTAELASDTQAVAHGHANQNLSITVSNAGAHNHAMDYWEGFTNWSAAVGAAAEPHAHIYFGPQQPARLFSTFYGQDHWHTHAHDVSVDYAVQPTTLRHQHSASFIVNASKPVENAVAGVASAAALPVAQAYKMPPAASIKYIKRVA